MNADDRLLAAARTHPSPLIFATISGAHLYGFASRDSDFDLRGCHVLPLVNVVGLDPGPWTIQIDRLDPDGFELDLVSHDAAKFFNLMLRKNGYVLEQLHSPLIVLTTPEHEELKSIARDCVTRYHCHHYLGFSETQWRLFEKEQPRRIKPLLYVYRVLLTGIHLMRTGEVEANLGTLNIEARIPEVDDLMTRKREGGEHDTFEGLDIEVHRRRYEKLREELKDVGERSSLPERASTRKALDDLLIRLRLSDFR